MSDRKVIAQLKINLRGHFGCWSERRAPLPPDLRQLISELADVHLVFTDLSDKAKTRFIGKWDVVIIAGALVDVT